MDIIRRKYQFIEQFMKINNVKKIEQLEAVLKDQMPEDEIVAYTVKGEALSKEKYLADLKEAEGEIEKGEYITHAELKEEVRSWRK